ncbi:Prefoldin subunit-domain-containing protein [Microdochium trichocladiopsis]|uniref:Prefoldin subunit-domain-containing protein n=1 Tax=Microdochium trichocladiopsis TaxID=1682393 RepID=A0A9P9BW36_9PEZI|nr:Prefoldin subunit-domain-containing protein [Microdochium trichocladiopsis]KAH7034681.1 Prefoldin subunit-domain-containing protein [Microdochium trichocladiopsis]
MDEPSTFERERQRLEETVERFTDAVNLWRQWKEEYETLREDVKLLPAAATREDRATARQDYEGELIDAKELVDIFGKDDSRSPDQILSILTNRLDYVAKNIDTLNRKVEDARRKLAEAENPSAAFDDDDDSLPMTEIVEQLDDDDNVISYSLRTPGKSQAQLMEALEKAGLKDVRAPVSTESAQNSDKSTHSKPVKESKRPPKETASSSAPKQDLEPEEESVVPKTLPSDKPTPKKSVTFSEDTKPEAQVNRPVPARTIEDILQEAAVQQIAIEDPVIPADDSPEDADLREDMLRYNRETMMYEMAPIVAELQLEEGSDFDTEDDWDEDDLEDDDDDDDDEEDQWGRSTKSVVTDDWKRQMLELKERMSNHTFASTAPDGATKHDDQDERMEGVGRISIKREAPLDPAKEASAAALNDDDSQTKKGVRFAAQLDIADESNRAVPKPPATSSSTPSSQPLVDPLSDIVERKSPAAATKPQNPTKKPSRFKQSLPGPSQTAAVAASFPVAFNGTPIAPEEPVDNTRYAPSGPEGQTLAETVLEREPSRKVVEPDEFDATLLHQQATEEYYKMRNKLVHRQGGFTKEDDSPVQPLGEEEGGPRKVSRFKAARLKKP